MLFQIQLKAQKVILHSNLLDPFKQNPYNYLIYITFLASAMVVRASGNEFPIPRIVKPINVLLSLNMTENKFNKSINI